jgi:hypothetical protein
VKDPKSLAKELRIGNSPDHIEILREAQDDVLSERRPLRNRAYPTYIIK